jgi:hypothetical protein
MGMQAWKETQITWRTFTWQPREIITKERGAEETIFGLPVSVPVIQMLKIHRGYVSVPGHGPVGYGF